jgi:hypothetical protein
MRKNLGSDFDAARQSMSDIGATRPSPPVTASYDRFPPIESRGPSPITSRSTRAEAAAYAQEISGEPRFENEPMTHDVHVGDTVNMPKGDCFEVTEQGNDTGRKSCQT